jgi:hypothetical protein
MLLFKQGLMKEVLLDVEEEESRHSRNKVEDTKTETEDEEDDSKTKKKSSSFSMLQIRLMVMIDWLSFGMTIVVFPLLLLEQVFAGDVALASYWNGLIGGLQGST